MKRNSISRDGAPRDGIRGDGASCEGLERTHRKGIGPYRSDVGTYCINGAGRRRRAGRGKDERASKSKITGEGAGHRTLLRGALFATFHARYESELKWNINDR